MFFFGTYNHNLDDKSRLTLPSKLREKLGGTVYITLGLDKCLYIYPEETFNKLAEELSKYSDFNQDTRGYKRTFFSNSYPCDVDKQGRIQLTKESIEKVFIKKDCVVIGVSDHVEIWDKDMFNKMSSEGEDNYESNASKLLNKGE